MISVWAGTTHVISASTQSLTMAGCMSWCIPRFKVVVRAQHGDEGSGMWSKDDSKVWG